MLRPYRLTLPLTLTSALTLQVPRITASLLIAVSKPDFTMDEAMQTRIAQVKIQTTLRLIGSP